VVGKRAGHDEINDFHYEMVFHFPSVYGLIDIFDSFQFSLKFSLDL
jgi:hypothetical protein